MDLVVGPDGIVYSSIHAARGQIGDSPAAASDLLESAPRDDARPTQPEVGNTTDSPARQALKPARHQLEWNPDREAELQRSRRHPDAMTFACGVCSIYSASTRELVAEHQVLAHLKQLNGLRTILESTINRSVSAPKVPRESIAGLSSLTRLTRKAQKRKARASKQAMITAGTREEQRNRDIVSRASQQAKIDAGTLARCQECRAAVRPDRMQRHAKRAHRRVVATREHEAGLRSGTSPTIPTKRAASSASDHGRDSASRMGTAEEIWGQGRRRPIDASPDGRLSRDQGRFGSFPSHDGYGDEDGA